MRIYVGNLSYEVTDDELRETFSEFGEVASADVIKDKFSGQSKGFGFVDMPDNDQAQQAIKTLNGKLVRSRNLTVNEARPKVPRSGGFR